MFPTLQDEKEVDEYGRSIAEISRRENRRLLNILERRRELNSTRGSKLSNSVFGIDCEGCSSDEDNNEEFSDIELEFKQKRF